MNDQFYSDLALIQKDKHQFKAYESAENTVLIAGPGSGKTRVLSLKAVSLAQSLIHKPEGLACISFSRESVRELKSRLKIYGYVPGNKDFIGTVHSFSLIHVIQPFAHLFPEYGVQYPVKIIPYNISDGIYEAVLKEMGITDPKTLTIIEIQKQRALALTGISQVHIGSTKLIEKAAELYETKLRETEYLDFTSIINISATIIREQEFVRRTLRSRFPWLLVDEYQDLGKALHEMVLELAFNAGIKLYAVGDVNQSIYGFTGGYPDFLIELTNNDDVTPIYLEANYRSSKHIIEASVAALKPTPPFPKYTAQKRTQDQADFSFITCKADMHEQFQTVAGKVIPKLVSQGVSLNEIGIIVDSNWETISMAQELQSKGIPFFIAKWSFENSAVVVWLQECALWCTGAQEQSFSGLFKFWKRLLVAHEDPRSTFENIQLKMLFHKILKNAKAIDDTFKWLSYLINELDLKSTVTDSELYPNEVKNLDKLLSEAMLHNLKNTTVSRFATLGEPNNEVTVTTRHSSKGLEFEAVILLGMEDQRFPSWRNVGNAAAIAEEQRLCYVCVSRAKKSCILLRSEIYNITKKDGSNWAKPHKASVFWTSLYSVFGNVSNTFTSANYK